MWHLSSLLCRLSSAAVCMEGIRFTVCLVTAAEFCDWLLACDVTGALHWTVMRQEDWASSHLLLWFMFMFCFTLQNYIFTNCAKCTVFFLILCSLLWENCKNCWGKKKKRKKEKKWSVRLQHLLNWSLCWLSAELPAPGFVIYKSSLVPCGQRGEKEELSLRLKFQEQHIFSERT